MKPAQVGTHAQIVDWYTLDDGLFGVSTFGTARFITEAVWQQDDGLFKAQINVLPEPPATQVPAAYLGTQRCAGALYRKGRRPVPPVHP